jgi:hypothetical protein
MSLRGTKQSKEWLDIKFPLDMRLILFFTFLDPETSSG